VQLDEATLRQVAMLTDGEYFQASSASDLTQVYRRLSSRLALERKEVEVSALLAAGAGVLLILACGLSVVWFRR
jgi:Ca-activated chloride channel family protein